MCQNQRPLIILQKLKLRLGLSIRLYLFLQPWLISYHHSMKIGDHDTLRLNIFFHSLSKKWGTLTIIDYNPIILCKMAMAILCHVIWDPLHHAECGSKTNVKATLCIPNFATTCYSHQNCRLHTCMCTLKHLKTLGLT